MTKKQALEWLVNILNKHEVPFQVVGGLAAIAYGSKRKLVDIDMYVPGDLFDKIMPEIKLYIVFGPEAAKDELWEDVYMEINYKGTTIEIGDSNHIAIYDHKNEKWAPQNIDYDKSVMKEVMGIKISVMPKEQLIAYKKILNRDVDKEDIKEIQ